jgi:hypothetical protein
VQSLAPKGRPITPAIVERLRCAATIDAQGKNQGGGDIHGSARVLTRLFLLARMVPVAIVILGIFLIPESTCRHEDADADHADRNGFRR